MKIFDANMVEAAADYNTWVDTIQESFNLKIDTDFKMPLRTHIDFDENTLLLMPCIGSKYFATKIVSLFPKNSEKGVPPLNGLVILNSGDTGELLALIEGSSLTALRTAAVGSFGIRKLAPARATNLGIIGLGRQGIYQSLFACSQRDFKKVFIHDQVKSNIKIFSDRVNSVYPELEIVEVDSSEEICANSEVIITATNSGKPVLPDSEALLQGKTIIGIGSYKPDMREFPDALYQMIDRIYVDTIDGLKESGDLIDPLTQGWLKPGQYIPGTEMTGDLSDNNSTRVFKSVGMALFDLAAATLVYEKSLVNPE